MAERVREASAGKPSRLKKVFFITSNPHKFSEVNEMCAGYGIELVHLQREYPEVRADTCEQVASASLFNISKTVKMPFIIEDSGLFIDSLNGFPGVYSAWVLRKVGLDGILRLMRGRRDRRAHFVSAIGYFDGKKAHVFTGTVDGSIAQEIRGRSGFGYDPLFIPKGYKFTFAENMTLKQKLSHRKKAVEQFLKHVLH